MTWSSQRYRSEGLALGVDGTVIERAIDQIERVIVPHSELSPVLTLNHLASEVARAIGSCESLFSVRLNIIAFSTFESALGDTG